MKPLSALACFALVASLLSASVARAEFADFSYSWSTSPSPPLFPGGTGSVALALAADGSASAAINGGATLIPGAAIITTSSAGGTTSPDHFNVAYSMTLHLTDTSSGQSDDLTFSGTLSGNLTSDSSTLTSTFDNPVTRHTTLGVHAYSVTIDPTLLNIPAPGSPTPAEINAQVKVHGPPVLPPPFQTPEPSTLLLAVVALPLMRAWRNRVAQTSS